MTYPTIFERLRAMQPAQAIFRAYEALHLEKGTVDGAEKAKRNAAFANTIGRTLAKARRCPDGECTEKCA
jgi:hypothetical protein